MQLPEVEERVEENSLVMIFLQRTYRVFRTESHPLAATERSPPAGKSRDMAPGSAEFAIIVDIA